MGLSRREFLAARWGSPVDQHPRSSTANLNLASLIVRTRPERLDRLRADLAALPGVDIHADPGDGRLVVTVEDTVSSDAADVVMDIHRLDGVLSATLVFQHAGDTDSDH